MKVLFWILASGLLIVMADYVATRSNADICQIPKSTTYKVFQ